MFKQTFGLRGDQIDKLAVLSKRTGAPKAELIRRAIDAYLRQEEVKEKWPLQNHQKTA